MERNKHKILREIRRARIVKVTGDAPKCRSQQCPSAGQGRRRHVRAPPDTIRLAEPPLIENWKFPLPRPGGSRDGRPHRGGHSQKGVTRITEAEGHSWRATNRRPNRSPARWESPRLKLVPFGTGDDPRYHWYTVGNSADSVQWSPFVRPRLTDPPAGASTHGARIRLHRMRPKTLVDC